MNVIHYQPWNTLDQMRREMDKVFASYADRDEGSSVVAADWLPAVDVREDPERFVIVADVPGVEPKDIDINMENGVLTISGKKEVESEEELKNYKRVERARGSFYRRFTLPESADAEKISAKFTNGVLEIVIPKQERVQPRKITIES
ncbi:MAG TPA: Hsp20/alpha crystallin family protein [Gammaproteobacteria bacterium]|nr:Hsp20/alpha crystallin family protein [Gammaproteobacteria bacterium]